MRVQPLHPEKYSFLKILEGDMALWRKSLFCLIFAKVLRQAPAAAQHRLLSVQGVRMLRYPPDIFYAEYYRAQQQTSKPPYREMPSLFSPKWVHGSYVFCFIFLNRQKCNPLWLFKLICLLGATCSAFFLGVSFSFILTFFCKFLKLLCGVTISVHVCV